MDPDFPFKGQPRRWYAYPVLSGAALIALSLFLLWIEPQTLLMFLFRVGVYLVALACFCVGAVLVLVGLDLARDVSKWQESLRVERWRAWMRERWRGPGEGD